MPARLDRPFERCHSLVVHRAAALRLCGFHGTDACSKLSRRYIKTDFAQGCALGGVLSPCVVRFLTVAARFYGLRANPAPRLFQNREQSAVLYPFKPASLLMKLLKIMKTARQTEQGPILSGPLAQLELAQLERLMANRAKARRRSVASWRGALSGASMALRAWNAWATACSPAVRLASIPTHAG